VPNSGSVQNQNINSSQPQSINKNSFNNDLNQGTMSNVEQVPRAYANEDVKPNFNNNVINQTAVPNSGSVQNQNINSSQPQQIKPNDFSNSVMNQNVIQNTPTAQNQSATNPFDSNQFNSLREEPISNQNQPVNNVKDLGITMPQESNYVGGIKPTTTVQGISQVGQTELNHQPMSNDIIFEEPKKKKFPLSVRETVLVAIALIGVIIVILQYVFGISLF